MFDLLSFPLAPGTCLLSVVFSGDLVCSAGMNGGGQKSRFLWSSRSGGYVNAQRKFHLPLGCSERLSAPLENLDIGKDVQRASSQGRFTL